MAEREPSNNVKDWRLLREMGGWAVAVVIATVAVLGYLDSKADDRYMTREDAAALRTRVEVLEKEMVSTDKKLDQVIQQNSAILGKLGEIRGRLDERNR